MSTKIYDGLRAVDRNPFTVQRRIKEVIEPMFQKRFDQAYKVADANKGKTWSEAFGPIFSPNGPSSEWDSKVIPGFSYEVANQLYELVEALYESAYRTFTVLDFGYEAIILPNGLSIRERPLVLVFSERAGGQYRDALIEAGVVTEYGYWNNTDQPDGMSDDDWDERRRAWDKFEVPSEDGLTIQQASKMNVTYKAAYPNGFGE